MIFRTEVIPKFFFLIFFSGSSESARREVYQLDLFHVESSVTPLSRISDIQGVLKNPNIYIEDIQGVRSKIL